ncbi:MAG: hypothetical protein AB1651_18090, partial [Pseudomonadota bacterium]
ERRLLADGGAGAPPQTAPALLLPFALGGLGIAALLLASRHRGVANAALAGGYALVCGLAGIVLAVGWLATEHWAMAANRNLLLLNPLWLLLLPATLGRARAPGLLTRAAAAALAALGLAALPVAWVGVQPNLHWVALLLPAHAAVLTPIAWDAVRRRHAPASCARAPLP